MHDSIYEELFGPYYATPEYGTLSTSVLKSTKGEKPDSEYGETPIRDVVFTPEYHLHSLLI